MLRHAFVAVLVFASLLHVVNSFPGNKVRCSNVNYPAGMFQPYQFRALSKFGNYFSKNLVA